jgi:hypothetical protein
VRVAGTVTAVTIDPHGKRFAAVWRPVGTSKAGPGSGARFRVWDTTGREILNIDEDIAAAVAFDESGDRLLVTPARQVQDGVQQCMGPIQLWDLTRSRLITGIGECASSAVVSATTIATHSLSDSRIRTWSTRNGSLIATSSDSVVAGALAFTSDGSRVAATIAEGVRVFDPTTGTLLLTVVISSRTTTPRSAIAEPILRFTDDGSRLILGGMLGLNFLEARSDNGLDARATAHSLIGPRLTRFRTSAGVQLAEEVIDEIGADDTLDPDLRRLAIEEVRQIGNWDLAALCNSSRTIATQPGLPARDYARALRMADVVTRLAPWSAYCVGVSALAMYRTSDYEGALKRLDAVLPLRPELLPAEIAVKAMTLFALGRRTEAAAAAAVLDSQPEVMQSADDDSLRLIKELRSLLSERK